MSEIKKDDLENVAGGISKDDQQKLNRREAMRRRAEQAGLPTADADSSTDDTPDGIDRA